MESEKLPLNRPTQETHKMGLLPNFVDQITSLQDWILQHYLNLNEDFTSTNLATDISRNILSFSVYEFLCSLAGLVFAWYAGSCLWYRYMSPISDVPGPFLASFSRLWLIQTLRRGRGARELAELHEKYGRYLST